MDSLDFFYLDIKLSTMLNPFVKNSKALVKLFFSS
jgi:hypothetical protein